MGIGIISTNKGDFTFQSAEDAIKFIRTVTQKIMIYGLAENNHILVLLFVSMEKRSI